MRRRSGLLRPLVWLALAFVSLLLLGVTYFVGMFSGGHELDETCASLGQRVDEEYRAEHWREPGQGFPLHNKCNADYDLVPVWVNPGIVVLGVLVVVCVGAGVWSAATTARR
ncbi:hypothetical protein OG787_19000 [Streptomyces sp. NBC_00075]|uniref:Integral membrane protein n=1 Tax=Streptomyces sp. NBC_00093 TaxID=2975649 RepID=A0AAU2A128_9ACTN